MAVPTFTVVMGVLTCVPFGLAVRDTVKGPEIKLSAEEQFRIDWERRDEDRARQEAKLAAEEAELAVAQSARHAVVIGTLHGPAVASLGSAFAGLTLGGPQPEEELLRARLVPLEEHQLSVVTSDDRPSLDSVVIFQPMIDAEETRRFCTNLRGALIDAWGQGVRSGPHLHIWVNPQLAQRAIIDDSRDCKLAIERYAPLETWFARSEKSVIPLWVIGKPAGRLVSQLGARARVAGKEIEWTERGIGTGAGSTHLRAIVRHGRIAGITATVRTEYETQDQLHLLISEVLGTEEDPPGSDVWKHQPRVQMDRGWELTLTIGTVPDED
ncbi:MAG: hypothetical protein WKG01_02310 [Kofleriaceae bacterium]